MSQTPINNLSEPHFSASSLKPGVSGESMNAPYGPKAVDECGIDSVHTEYNPVDNHTLHGDFAVGKLSGLHEPEKEVSSERP
jgi:hypothetical protein